MRFGSSALVKAMVVAAVALLLLIPVQMLRNLVEEGAQMREQAVASVSRGWGGRQLLGGPVTAIPITVVADNSYTSLRTWYVLPESLTVEAELDVQDERRKLGVYEVPVYLARIHAVAKFDVAAKLASVTAERGRMTVHFDRARLLLPVSDARGVRDVKLDGEALAPEFEPERGFPIATLAAPLRADTGLDKGEHSFDIALEVAGTESQRVARGGVSPVRDSCDGDGRHAPPRLVPAKRQAGRERPRVSMTRNRAVSAPVTAAQPEQAGNLHHRVSSVAGQLLTDENGDSLPSQPSADGSGTGFGAFHHGKPAPQE